MVPYYLLHIHCIICHATAQSSVPCPVLSYPVMSCCQSCPVMLSVLFPVACPLSCPLSCPPSCPLSCPLSCPVLSFVLSSVLSSVLSLLLQSDRRPPSPTRRPPRGSLCHAVNPMMLHLYDSIILFITLYEFSNISLYRTICNIVTIWYTIWLAG